MEHFITYLQRYGHLTPQDSARIREVTRSISLPKATKLSEAARIPQELWFVVDGVTRVYYYTDTGKEVTKYFIDNGNITTDGSSYLYRLPTTAYVETVTDCKLLSISRSAFEKLAESIPSWNELFLHLLAHGMTQKVDRISPMLSETAEERYLHFLQRFPDLHNRIPLHLLASYIGVTKSSLSRIRRSLVPTQNGVGTDD
ncbi:CRP-like cAMP-binding protein [Neolewinella xylanilytica]|uniref:CRP-like cAMP-binding protein n=1 Tax=Neolewinella xylanilytica TaxID=1514080 RepID=A0A2S6I1D3_9BACT|nr:Crp/Fnr family transcriptional regulator [Neolewinella xylanilytica]PPK84774.1 CRP-like cAMP-binding protein [Neolewinella xylanilytica]